jgi:hypothetical protein
MNIRKLLQLLSLALLLYLLADAFVHIEWAVTKNNALTSMQKAEIDRIQNMDTLKQKAKEELDVGRNIHRCYSDRSMTNFWLLAALVTIQIVLLYNRKARS